ncbi:hypothetical protein ELE36_18565 [Pseudolysobacter antarcticus]|uniref:Knr4/Smi1-like domain-containing protein n=1 Tax=Pseudolysobacter antarcticus TaxID=2511995 RepID=A0A411HNZ2_9GAMM|nr:SMI1/KNR4 family protein [Pseudolysobacter antarcticus]QBB72207.1 hypothetical protein ELE36_18565 [Pseudolysobacter antarcticus]
MTSLILDKSFPSDWAGLSSKDRAFFDGLPADYRAFLDQTNGGFVLRGCPATFTIAIDRRHEGKVVSTSQTSEVEEFFAIIPSSDRPYLAQYGQVPASLLHEHWGRHADEEFLPLNVVVIASCTQNCLLACSLNTDDYGTIYYWEWYWRYPWFSKFFDDQIAKAQSKFHDVDTILSDDKHPLYAKAFNALNYATLVKVADSFTEFLGSLTEASEVDT